MRLFIGVELHDGAKSYLKSVQESLKPVTLKGNFTLFDNFHITLRYLGETLDVMVDEICDLIEDMIEDIEPFSLKFGPIGTFSKRGSSLVFLQVLDSDKQLTRLHHRLETALRSLGFEADERRYNPHVTLAREVKTNDDVNLALALPRYPQTMLIDKLTLFESHRIHGRLTYTTVFEAAFQKKG